MNTTLDAEREVAKISRADFEIEDHGIPVWNVMFEGDGWRQGFGGYLADVSFMCRLLSTAGVDSMSQLKGKSVWVTHTHTEILKVEPLYKKDGEPFIVEDWRKWVQERMGPLKLSPYEIRTGKKP